MNVALTQIPGIGPKIAEKLQHAGVHQVLDLLFHFPTGNEDRTHTTPIHQVIPNQNAYIEGQILKAEIKYQPRRMLIITVSDGTGELQIRFFYFQQAQYRKLQLAERICCYGIVRQIGRYRQMVHPSYQILLADESAPLAAAPKAVYPTLAGLSTNKVSQLMRYTLQHITEFALPEILPEALRMRYSLMPLPRALQLAHEPALSSQQRTNQQEQAIARLAFEELLAHRLALLKIRSIRCTQKAPSLTDEQQWCPQFQASLMFRLTDAQHNAIKTIQADLKQTYPMQRLLQGDVGSGKTIVAMFAALQAVSAGYQVALMVPTEILAEQHFISCQQLAHRFPLTVALLKSKLATKEKRLLLRSIAEGNVSLVIGTHALFQANVNFSRLGLIIFDEHHRFGVKQRKLLLDKASQQKEQAHQLIMTATPIPRTLAMTYYADLDVTNLDEMPPGRMPVQTNLISQDKRDAVIKRIQHAILQQRQIYWVCPLVEDSENLDYQAAEALYLQLKTKLPHARIGLIHGKLASEKKQETMQAFSQHQLDILVATTVIEVGVNVPNASIMIIENAERLGLAQLHQLRGRVGRGSTDSYCLLLYQAPLSKISLQRLKVLHGETNGFKIAEADLAIRGPGEYFGTQQTGNIHFKIANIARDQTLFPLVASAADILQKQYPQAIPLLFERWLGENQRYFQA